MYCVLFVYSVVQRSWYFSVFLIIYIALNHIPCFVVMTNLWSLFPIWVTWHWVNQGDEVALLIYTARGSPKLTFLDPSIPHKNIWPLHRNVNVWMLIHARMFILKWLNNKSINYVFIDWVWNGLNYANLQINSKSLTVFAKSLKSHCFGQVANATPSTSSHIFL